MFTSERIDSIKLIDFGISIFVDQPVKDRVGTINYLAPELFTGNYDCKIDVWAVGIIMYTILVGYQPFQGKENEVLIKIKQGVVPYDGIIILIRARLE